jgi:hypothetical protein
MKRFFLIFIMVVVFLLAIITALVYQEKLNTEVWARETEIRLLKEDLRQEAAFRKADRDEFNFRLNRLESHLNLINEYRSSKEPIP